MPFTYRDKPKLADRLRGKSGEEILNELKSDLNSEGRMFFDSPSFRTRQNISGFSRDFPFDDNQNRTNIRSYLDEIASRHPEFADQLKEPPWEGDFNNYSFGRKRRGSNSGREENQAGEASGSSEAPTEEKEQRQNLTNFGLRNTVPLGPEAVAEEERKQRSMSAPPDNRTSDKPKRFVTKYEIPVMNDPKRDIPSPTPDTAGKGGQEQPKGNNAPNVRVIPIQVEGRDTPIVNTNIDTSTNFGGETFREPSFEGRLPRDFGTYQRHSPRFAHKERSATPPQYPYAPQYQHYMSPNQSPFASQEQFIPPQQQPSFAHQHHPQKPAPTHHHHHHQQQQTHFPQAQKHPQGDETDSKPPAPPPQPKPAPPKDPIEKVQSIQKEVDELMKQVEAFSGKSRTDKQYLMLDELLTKQILCLDEIDTEGKENVRQARKDTIRSIQNVINMLENKVPVSESNENTNEVVSNKEENKAQESGSAQKKEVENTKERTQLENKESEEMELSEKDSSESQFSLSSEQSEEQQEQQQQQKHPLPKENKEKV